MQHLPSGRCDSECKEWYLAGKTPKNTSKAASKGTQKAPLSRSKKIVLASAIAIDEDHTTDFVIGIEEERLRMDDPFQSLKEAGTSAEEIYGVSPLVDNHFVARADNATSKNQPDLVSSDSVSVPRASDDLATRGQTLNQSNCLSSDSKPLDFREPPQESMTSDEEGIPLWNRLQMRGCGKALSPDKLIPFNNSFVELALQSTTKCDKPEISDVLDLDTDLTTKRLR